MGLLVVAVVNLAKRLCDSKIYNHYQKLSRLQLNHILKAILIELENNRPYTKEIVWQKKTSNPHSKVKLMKMKLTFVVDIFVLQYE
jgi:hypothetical protein